MAQEVVLIAVHGMGKTPDTFADAFESKLAAELGDRWPRVYFDTVYYQEILQPNQTRLFDTIKARDEIDWVSLRRFFLYGFSDAAGLERRAHVRGSPYEAAQKLIKAALDGAFDFFGGPRPVVVIAQSLGVQVISNYVWDAQKAAPGQGIWKDGGPQDVPKGSPKDRFRRLKMLRYFYTTGCNIPIFVGGLPEDKIKAVATASKGYSFRWENFYDPDDVLGWPLRNLSPSYRSAVHKDHPVNAGSGLLRALASWTPLSHSAYWTDDDVLEPLARDIRSLLS